MSEFVSTPLKYLVADRITNGVGLPAEHENPDWPRYIRTTDIAGPRTLRQDVWYSQPPDLIKQAGVERGDLLLTNAGTIGKSYLHASNTPAVYAGYLTRVRLDPSRADPHYIAYWCQSQPYWDQINVGATRSTIDNFSSGKYQDLRVPLPSLAIQRRIADMLDAETARIDTLVEKNERVLGLMDLRDKSTIDRLVNSGEAIDEHGWGALTEWSRVPIRSLTRTLFVDGDWIESPFITDSGVRLIQTGNIGIGRYKEQGFRYVSDETFDELRCTEVLPGDVLICRLADPVGRACVAPDLGVRMITSVDVTIVRPKPGVLADYVALILSTERWLQRLGAMSQGGTRDRIARLKLGELRVPLPDLETQRRIINQWSTISERSSRLRTRVTRQQELLKLRRQALVTAAVTGQIEV